MARSRSSAFGSLLKRFRLAAGLTQEDLAEKALISARAISDLERGVNKSARRDTVDQIAQALQLSAEDRASLDAAAAHVERWTHPASTTGSEGETSLKTFLIADVRGYSRFTQERGDEAAARLAGKMAVLSRDVVASFGGHVIELRGDEVLVVFSSARRALQAAMEMQRRCTEESESDPELPLPVGIGLDAGEPVAVEGGYRGGALNLAARLCALAGAGEVLASDTVTNLARKVEGLTYAERGFAHLKGFADPIRVIEIGTRSGPDHGHERDTSLFPYRDGVPPRTPIGGFLGALPGGVMVGRSQELEHILASIDVVAGGTGQLILLTGEAGVGKTRLAQEATLALRDRGFLVASGRCYEPQQVTPYYPFQEMLTTVYDLAPTALKAEAAHRWPYLARLLPDQLGRSPGLPPDGQDERLRLFRAVTGLVQAIAEDTPLALLVDDLHWSDGASLELLQHLSRHTRAYRVFLFGTYRDTESEYRERLAGTLRDLNREALADRVVLRRLDRDGTASLIKSTLGARHISDELTGLVHGYTEGNPFFTQEVVRTLVERGDLFRDGDKWMCGELDDLWVPESVRSTIQERVSRLSPDAQTLLEEASVLGQAFRFNDLRLLIGRDEDEIEGVLDVVANAGLIREAGGDKYVFNHALTQQALYGGLSGRRKRRLHLAAVEALEQRPERERETRGAELVRHSVRSGEVERAIRYATQSADRAVELSAAREAEKQYRFALRLLGQLPPDHQQVTVLEAEVLEKLGVLLRTVARYDEALAALEKAAVIFQALTDLEAEGRATAQIGYAYHGKGMPHEGIRAVRSVLNKMQAPAGSEQPSVELLSRAGAGLNLSLSTLLIQAGDFEASLVASEQAKDLATAVGDARTLAQAETYRVYSFLLLGREQDALQLLNRAVDLAEGVDDMDTLFLALDSAAETYLVTGELRLSRTYRERALSVTERMGDPVKTGHELTNIGHIAFCLGDWISARAHLDRARDVLEPAESSLALAEALVWLGALSVAEGDRGMGKRYLEDGLSIGEATANPFVLVAAHAQLAELELVEGQPENARQRLLAVLTRPRTGEREVIPVLHLLAWAHLDLGQIGLAEDVIEQAMKDATSHRDLLILTDVHRVRGWVFGGRRRWHDALDAFDNGLALARSLPCPYAEARLLHARSTALAALGMNDSAKNTLAHALAAFRQLGAQENVLKLQEMVPDAR